MLAILRKKYPVSTNSAVSSEIGVGTRLVASKAAELGLEKERAAMKEKASRIVLDNYGKCSYPELSRLAGVSLRTVSRIAARHGLSRDRSDTARFISSRRRELVRREKLRLRLGLEAISRIKVTI